MEKVKKNKRKYAEKLAYLLVSFEPSLFLASLNGCKS